MERNETPPQRNGSQTLSPGSMSFGYFFLFFSKRATWKFRRAASPGVIPLGASEAFWRPAVGRGGPRWCHDLYLSPNLKLLHAG